MDRLVLDLRGAVRALRRAPGFALVAIATLALGLGATTAIFAVLKGVVLDPLPYRDADRLVWIDSPVPGVGENAAWGLSQAGFFHFAEHARSLESLGGFAANVEMNLSSAEGAARVRGAVVTPGLLEVLRARPARGRSLTEEDGRPDAPAVAVLGHSFWQQQYGGDPGVIGRTIELEAQPAEVVGIMEPGLQLPEQPVDVWVPAQLDPAAPPANFHWIQAVGRLRAGATPEQAQTELVGLTGRFVELFPAAYDEGFMRETGFTTRVMPLRTHVIGEMSSAIWILFASVGLVLLIACANVANLFLVRSETRRREVAVCAALGASRSDLARRFLAESLVLAAAAGGLGLALAEGGLRLLLAAAPADLPRSGEIALDGAAVLFALGASLVSGLLFGLIPLVRARLDVATLRSGGRGQTTAPAQQRVRSALVVGQIALALVLLVAAGLMLRSFQQLRSVEPGFRPANVLTVQLSLPWARYPGAEAVSRFHEEVAARVEALPGVERASASTGLPMVSPGGCAAVFVEEHRGRAGYEPPCINTPRVLPGFFEALGIRVEGEQPTWSDVNRRAGGVVVSRGAAERFWPGEDPIGKGIRGNGWSDPYYRVVGVAEDVRWSGLDEPAGETVYFPPLPMEGAWLWPVNQMTLVVYGATSNPTQHVAAIRGIVSELDPQIPLGTVQTMEQIVSRSVARASFVMLLLAIGAAMALVLSAVGMYGVLSYVVGQRTGEIGVRMALGAQPGDVLRLVLRGGLALTVIGIALGLTGAYAVTRVLSSLLYGVSATDPLAFAAVTLILAAVAMTATYLPARRATRVDPMLALRSE